MNKLLVLLLLLILLSASSHTGNLIQDGDFQNFVVPPNLIHYQQRGYYQWLQESQYWEKSNNLRLQIRYSDTFITTNTLQINTLILTCQTVNLQIGRKYLLKYDGFVANYLYQVKVGVYANQNKVSQVNIPTSQTFAKKSDYFEPIETTNKICFNQTHKPSNFWLAQGILLDNITLHRVYQHFVQINYQIHEDLGKIYIITNFTQNTILQLFMNQYRLFLNDKMIEQTHISLREDQIIFYSSQNSLNLDQITFQLVNDDPLTEFYIIKVQESKRFLYLGEQDKKIASTIDQIIQVINDPTKMLMSSIKTTLFSYIILGFLSYWNLSLLYYFAGFNAMPEFCKRAYQSLIHLHYQKINIYNILPQSISRNLKQWKDAIKTFEIQYASKQTQNFLSFGSFGFSSKTLEGHIDSLFLLILLFVKIIAVLIIYLFLPQKLQKKIKIGKLIMVITSAEMIGLAPQTIITTGIGISHGSENTIELWLKIGHLIMFLICLICTFLSPFIQISQLICSIRSQQIEEFFVMIGYQMKAHQKLIPKQNLSDVSKRQMYIKNSKKKFQQKQKFNLCKRTGCLFLLGITENAQIILIPTMLIFGSNSSFITTAWIQLFLQSWCLWKSLKYLNLKDKIFKISMNIIWFAHNLCFTVFLYYSDTYKQINNLNSQKLIIIMGVGCIVTILIGGAIEIMSSFADIVIKIKQIIIAVKSVYFTQNKIKPQKQHEQVIESNEQCSMNSPGQNKDKKQQNPTFQGNLTIIYNYDSRSIKKQQGQHKILQTNKKQYNSKTQKSVKFKKAKDINYQNSLQQQQVEIQQVVLHNQLKQN